MPVYISSDFGHRWTASSVAAFVNYQIAMSADGKYVVAPAYNSFVYYSDDYGQTYAPSNSISTYW